MPARQSLNTRRRTPGGIARLLLLVLLVAGFGFLASRSEATPATSEAGPADESLADAERAVEALLDPERSAQALSMLPADFAAVTGVEAASQKALDGTVRAVHVGGGCSAPWGDDSTRWDFGTPCRSHDLGYDLLRYAEKKGSPLRAELREALDDRLSDDMYATCDVNPKGTPGLCRGVAAIYTAGLVVNSWHQRWGPPVGEPLLPLLAGVVVIGVLLWHRFRERLLGASTAAPRPDSAPRRSRGIVPAMPWTLLGVGSVVVLILGESTVALARWADVGGQWLWPLTWLTQSAVLFFFAAGHSNAAAWDASSRTGGGVRAYLAHRGSWLLRLTLVFAVVAFAVPLALELLHVPPTTVEGVVRMALHPLWLLGFYLLTVVLTPLMQALHRRAPRAVPLGLALALAGAEWTTTLTTSSWPHHLGTLTLALLAQQAAFAHRDGFTPTRRQLLLTAGAGTGALTIGVTTGVLPLTVLGVADAPPALAGPTTAVLLVGVVHIAVLGLLRARLGRLVCRPPILRVAGLASRAPMSLYLLFLATVLLLVSAVYLPRRLGSGFGAPGVEPRALLATTLLVGPAVFVFVWIERHVWHRPPPFPVWSHTQAGLDRLFSHGATVAGFGFAVLGVFGFALATLNTTPTALSGLLLDPVQSLVHLLLGMSLLHSVRTGSTNTPGIWLLTAAACVPPLLSVTAAPSPDSVGVVVHAMTCLVAVAAAVTTTVIALTSPSRGARG
ncbi:phospholipase A2 [Saccharomonospora cyanea]|uniref:Prokaryotic phospholipase A2 n=1 Tax=Saccharomonospora cyanea NA-134 TaxID=882082 RepID=H5XGW5_9PSEU|nr:phospholipase A2 [Saccharomonospora cyanea]EHR62692.1 Prokaryotic phospholipase A2 [Saccharomonospora cyanea NA-134]